MAFLFLKFENRMLSSLMCTVADSVIYIHLGKMIFNVHFSDHFNFVRLKSQLNWQNINQNLNLIFCHNISHDANRMSKNWFVFSITWVVTLHQFTTHLYIRYINCNFFIITTTTEGTLWWWYLYISESFSTHFQTF